MDAAQLETDEQLILRARTGDEAAFAVLVHRYEHPLYAYARRLLGDASEAEDIFQESFLRVFRHLGQIDTNRPFRPWLYRVATNLCIDRRRMRGRRPAVTLEHDVAVPVDPRANPRARASARERAARLEAAVARLSEKHRAVFLLVRYEGLSYEEAAETLEIPLGTVKSRMNTAVNLLMHWMQET